MKTQAFFALAALMLVTQAAHAIGNVTVNFRTGSQRSCINEFTLSKDGDDYFVHGDGCFRAPDFKLSRDLRKHSTHNYIFNGRHPEEITVINSQGGRKVVSLAKNPKEYRAAVAYTRKLTALIVQQARRQSADRVAEPNARAVAAEIKRKLANQKLRNLRRG